LFLFLFIPLKGAVFNMVNFNPHQRIVVVVVVIMAIEVAGEETVYVLTDLTTILIEAQDIKQNQ
jgi:hypothetical protein